MNHFFGLFGLDRPADTIQSLFNQPPTWSDPHVAFMGAPVWTDPTERIIVCGELVLDNLAGLQRQLELPDAEAGTVVAALYLRHGLDVGGHLLGMVAVAIWDTLEQRLVLLRDGVGARTMYYSHQQGACWFASRLATLSRCPALSTELSLTALQTYLTFSFVPGHETMYRDIFELRPGTTLTLPDQHHQTYWQPREKLSETDDSLESHAVRLRALLEEAVHDSLPADGPVGVYLSGGLDSSLITALAARQAAGPVHTYAIHFGTQYPNELEFAQQVADHCQTEHHVLDVSAKRVRQHLFETMTALDDPIGDPLTVPNLLLGKAAAQDVSVILNGEGGDPCFGGPKNQPLILNELYGSQQARAESYLRAYRKCYAELPQLLKADVQAALREAEPQENLLTPILNGSSMRHFLNKLMLINVQFKGADHILTKVNNLTTVNGLLGRSPLFDPRVVEASFAIPPQYKLIGADEKGVLKAAVTDLLPASIINRPKSGMRVPVQRWFRWELWLYARWMLLSPRARIYQYVNRAVVWRWLGYEGSVWPRYGAKLWLLLTLEVWLQAQNK